MLGNITRCVTAREIWSVLEDLFQSQSKARVLQLKLQLQTTKKGDLSVDDYFLKMRSYADLLAAAGYPVSNDDLALQILNGFDLEYDGVMVNFTNRPETISQQEVQFALQAQEICFQSQQFSSFANVAYHRGGGRGFIARGRG